MKMENTTKQVIQNAREIMESKGECCPVYVGFEKKTYKLTAQEMSEITRALYLADCDIPEEPNSEK